MKQGKTNAMRQLDKAGIHYTMREYDTGDGAIDGMAVAKKINEAPEHVFKTLVAKGAAGEICVFCIPVCEELDLKRAAQAAGQKSVAMLPVAAITPTTGYVRGGVSPIGMKKRYRTWLHASAAAHDTILVSGGRIGLQIQIAPAALAQLLGAEYFE